MHRYTPDPSGTFCTAINPNTQNECGLGKAHGSHDLLPDAPPVMPGDQPGDGTAAQDLFQRIERDDNSPLARVFCALAIERGRGATDEELLAHAETVGLGPNTVRPRRVDLHNAGLVTVAVHQGRELTRPTSTGRQARVWVLTDRAWALLAATTHRSAA